MNLHQNEFIEHAYKHEANMRIALLAGLSFPDLRSQLINEFVDDLSSTLSNAGWLCEDAKAWSKTYWLRYRKGYWPENIWVGIGPKGNFSGHDFGVIAHDALVEKELRRAISSRLQDLRSAKMENYCAWRISMGESYWNLNSIEGLLAISRFQRDSAVADLAGRINQVGDLLEPLFQR